MDLGFIPSLIVYPNPAQDQVMLTIGYIQSEKASIKMMDYTGKIVADIPVNLIEGENQLEIPVSSLAQGIYLLTIESEHLNTSQRLIVE